ncbi:transcriptional repressor LexA [Pelistega suis]|uniref:LexA repressor n=1 Tax=Pelistega suis TaxID=1631957 RepID=A0A849P217_9BURK|nr:transcriptional repressor LexA [Pelistega suis]NOL51490.1 transcriptional repressor LexA [Pelistega suis]
MNTKLTQRQLEVLTLIKETIERTGIPPTRAEIARDLGFKSPNAAEDHIKALTKKGAIILNPGASRGIRLNPDFIVDVFPDSADSLVNKAKSVVKAASQQLSQAVQQTTELIKDTRLSLPIVGRVAAGNPINAIEHHENTLHLDPSIFSATPDYLLKVKGESMKDIGILDGDLLAVKKTSSVRNGQIVVARIDEEVTVKRFQKNGAIIELHPENSDFKPIIVDGSQHFEIEGIAVGLIRPDTMWH